MRPTLRLTLISLAVAAALPQTAAADGWTGTGELGLAAARGNARSENFNTKLDFINEDERWKHTFGVGVLRAKGEISGDFDGDGVLDERFELTANRLSLAGSSAIKMNERASWISALRYEQDDFNSYDNQTTFSIGYGYTLYKTDRGQLHAELGPGYRRAEVAATGETESNLIARGLVEWSQTITDTTVLSNKLLVESGKDNTFAQNDFGVAVSMTEKMALKAGLQARYNSETTPETKSTDLLTTVNLVYSFK